MPIVSIEHLPKEGVLLGIDPGKRTLGVASTDSERILVTPVETIHRGRKLEPSLNRMYEIIDEREGVGLVIGLPLNMDGSRGPSAQAAFALAHQILKKLDLPIVMFDERLTTAQVERAMIAADMSRKRRAEEIDAAAAALILKSAIEQLRKPA
ncbi:MAG: Holliday junction resolvase RuvX [Pseudomonadota bacterium]